MSKINLTHRHFLLTKVFISYLKSVAILFLVAIFGVIFCFVVVVAATCGVGFFLISLVHNRKF